MFVWVITDGEPNMSSYAMDLSKKKARALRALTDAPIWFESIIRRAEKKKTRVEKGNVIWTHCFCHEERLEVLERNSVSFEISPPSSIWGTRLSYAIENYRFPWTDSEETERTGGEIQLRTDRWWYQ